MTSPAAPDDEWDNLPTRGRSESVSEENWWDAPAPRARAVAVSQGTLAADHTHGRLGIVFLFSKLYVDEQPVWLMPTRGRSTAVTQRGQDVSWEGFKATIGGWVTDLVRWVKAKIEAALAYLDANIERVITDVISKTVDAIMSELSTMWTELVPILGAGGRALEGMRTMFTSAKALFDTWFSSNCAAVVDGAPEIIVQSLRSAMKRSLLEGLVTTIKAGLDITAQIISAGVSTLGEKVVGVIVKAVKTIVETVLRARERAALQSFFGQAEMHWINRNAFDAIHKDHTRFVAWYKPVALGIPAVAAITLLSHIAGDKVAFLAMYQDRLAEVTPTQFQNGANNLDAMKGWSRDYLTKSGYSFTSTDTMVSRLLGFPDVAPTEVITSGLTLAQASTATSRSRRA